MMKKFMVKITFLLLLTPLLLTFLTAQILAVQPGLITFIKGTGDPVTGATTEIWVSNPDGSGQRRFFTDPYYPLYPNWSPDGTRLAMTAWASNTSTWEVWTVNGIGGDPRQITKLGGRLVNDEKVTTWIKQMKKPSINYNNTKVCFTLQSQTFSPNAYQEDPEPWWCNIDGSGAARIEEIWKVAYAGQMDFSPLNDTIAFAGFDFRVWQHYGTAPQNVISLRAPNGQVTYLSNPSYGYNFDIQDHQGTPKWSPSGQKVCFVNTMLVGVTGYQYGVSVINANGTGQQMIYGPTPKPIGQADWFQDDNHIVFNVEDASWSTYVKNLSTGALSKLSLPTDLAFPTWGLAVPPPKTLSRLFGDTRYETGVEISKKGWGNADNVVLARGDMFPDALAGAPLAAKLNAPLLLTNSDKLNSSTSAEMKRLKAKTVYILGTADAVSQQVEKDITDQLGISATNIKRIGGDTRYETAGEIGKNLNPPANKTAIIAYGENYPDALAGASMAAYQGMPILLVKQDAVPAATQEVLKTLKISKSIIVGQADVVSTGVENWLNSNGYCPTRLGGDDRYITCQLIADHALKNMGMNANSIGVALGENFPDALTLGPLAGKFRAPVLLVRDTFIPDKIKEFITTHKNDTYQVYIAGGSDVVSDGVADEIKTTIGAK